MDVFEFAFIGSILLGALLAKWGNKEQENLRKAENERECV